MCSHLGIPNTRPRCAVSNRLGAATALGQMAEPLGRQADLADSHLLEVRIDISHSCAFLAESYISFQEQRKGTGT